MIARLLMGVLLAGIPATVAAEAGNPVPDKTTGVSLAGSGLISLPDTSTLEPGRTSAALAFDNQDRDPLRLDVLDLSVAWIVGLKPRLETYGHAVLSRAVAVSPRTTLFPSPIDLIVPAGQPVPHRPYYPLYQPIPYVNRTGRSQLGRFLPGDAVFGVKRTLRAPLGKRPGVAVSGEVKLPLTRDLADLQSGAGTGAVDECMRVTAEWRGRGRSLLTSAAYTRRGRPTWGDRLIVFGPSGGAEVTDLPLRLPNEVGLGLGLRQTITSRAALVAEVTRVVEVGGHTPAFTQAGPLDVSAGAQLRWRGARATLCLRYHANSVPPFSRQASPLGGLADVTGVSEADLAAYLGAIGGDAALAFLRHRSQSALAFPAAGPPLPEGTRILPPDFTVAAHDRLAYVIVLGWTLGTGRRR